MSKTTELIDLHEQAGKVLEEVKLLEIENKSLQSSIRGFGGIFSSLKIEWESEISKNNDNIVVLMSAYSDILNKIQEESK